MASGARNPVLNLPLEQIMRCEIALAMRQVLGIYTVGGFLLAWNDPAKQRAIEQLFDTPQQARHAAAICAGWIGAISTFTPMQLPVTGWWRADQPLPQAA